MTTVPTYQVLVEDIKALGVEHVFGLMSDDTAVFATALDSAGIRFYGARHENNAIAMAEGYAWRTGGLAVAVIGRGPATANGLHAATWEIWNFTKRTLARRGGGWPRNSCCKTCASACGPCGKARGLRQWP